MGSAEWSSEGSDQPSQLAEGQVEHSAFRADILENDPRSEGLDTFTTERAITDSQGNVVRDADGHFGRPDYVDYQENVIVDLKPIHEGESPEDIYAAYQEQLDRYVDLYESGRGTTPDLYLSFYEAD